MTDTVRRAQSSVPSRRDFLKSSTAAAVGGAMLSGLALPRSVHAGVDDVLKIGLIGCGGRGTGAAAQALAADKNVKLTAMGDAFDDRLHSSLENLKKQTPTEKIDVAKTVASSVSTPTSRSSTAASTWCLLCHAAPLPPGASEGGRRGRQARLCREAGGRRRARRPQRAGDGGRSQEEGPGGRLGPLLPLRPAGTRDDEADPRRRDRRRRGHQRQLQYRHLLDARRASPSGPTWSTRCATGSTSPGSRATTTSSSTSTASTRPPGS